LQQVVSRRIDPTSSATVAIGVLRAGEIENVIPEVAEARGTLRALEPHTRTALSTLVTETVHNLAKAYGCDAEVYLTEGEPAVVNDSTLTRHVRGALKQANLRLAPPLRSCGSDDFGYYQSVAPSVLMFVGLKGAPNWRDVPLHHPEFLPPAETVAAVARAQAAAYVGAAAAIGGD
jgi:amidohydrolase